jgi:predicted nucleotidyltransferase
MHEKNIKADFFLNYRFLKQLKALSFVDEIWLFGSRARGDHQDRSDIDLAIVCGEEYDWQQVKNIIEEARIIFEHIKTYRHVFEETYLLLKNKYQLS